MKKNIILILMLLLNVLGVSAATDLIDLVRGEYEGKADSLEYCLIENFMNKQKGTFWGSPNDVNGDSWNMYWQQAHAIDVIIYAYERYMKEGNTAKADEYKGYMESWFSNHGNNWHSGTWTNEFTDDMGWIGLAIFHMGDATGLTKYYRTAKSIYATIAKRKKQDEYGTYLNQRETDQYSPGTCTMAPASLLASKLYLYYGDESYLEDAKAYYDYLVAKEIVKSDGRCEEPPLTYTQGTLAEACRYLYHITGTNDYKNKAYLYISYAFTNGRCTNNGLLRDEGHDGNQSIFKAVLIPYAVNFVLDDEMTYTRRKTILQKIQDNADALWEHLDKDAYPQMYCPYYWGTYFNNSEPASMGAMVSGASLFENTTRMTKAINEQAMGIEQAPVASNESEAVYNINGQKVTESYKGIIIRNGRKYVNR